MKIYKLKLLVVLLIVFSFGSCNDAIFYKITVEPPKLVPLIGGSPTNFVVYGVKLYVASGKQIYSYDGNSWSSKEFGGRVGCLAATTGALYALYLYNDGGDGRIKNYDSGNDLSLSNVQSIHASGDVLFACVRNDDNTTYKVYYKKESDPGFTEIPDTFSSILNGVASDNTYYYLCVNEGIYYIKKSEINTASNLPVLGKDYRFVGIINLSIDYVAAISEKGDLYEISNAVISDKKAGFNDGRYSTGALAIWYKDAKPCLLLAGRKEDYYSTTSGYSNGYVEIALDETTGKIKDGAVFNEPGKIAPTSIDSYDRYTPSLGKKLINHIIQTPSAIDANMIMFASTQQDGVWSYRDHGDGIAWNAHEK